MTVTLRKALPSDAPAMRDSVTMTWLGETTSAAGKSGFNGYLVGTLIFGLLRQRAKRSKA